MVTVRPGKTSDLVELRSTVAPAAAELVADVTASAPNVATTVVIILAA